MILLNQAGSAGLSSGWNPMEEFAVWNPADEWITLVYVCWDILVSPSRDLKYVLRRFSHTYDWLFWFSYCTVISLCILACVLLWMSLTDLLLSGFVRECVYPSSACSPLCHISFLIRISSWIDDFITKSTAGSNKDMLLLQVVLFCRWHCWCPRQSRKCCFAKVQVWIVQAALVGYCILVVVCSSSGERTEYHCCWPEVCLTPAVVWCSKFCLASEKLPLFFPPHLDCKGGEKKQRERKFQFCFLQLIWEVQWPATCNLFQWKYWAGCSSLNVLINFIGWTRRILATWNKLQVVSPLCQLKY